MKTITRSSQVKEAESACGYEIYVKGQIADGSIVFCPNTMNWRQANDAKLRLKAAGYAWGKWKAQGKGTIRGWKKV